MFAARILAAALLLTPVQYGPNQNPYGGRNSYNAAQAEEDPCRATAAMPTIVVDAERNEPTLSRAENITSLTQNSAGIYRPEGATGPAWHTQGLTQSMFVYKRNIAAQKITESNGLSCIRVKDIHFTIVLQPQVWVANEFPAGSCMYNAIAGHEQKHVNVDRIVTDRHLPQIRAALAQLSEGRAMFGPIADAQVDGQYQQFLDQLKEVLDDEIQSMSAEERRAQQAVDTLQEYQRVANLCPGQR